MITYSYDLNKVVMKDNVIPYRLRADSVYETGKTYWNSYWQKKYKVIEVSYDMQFHYPRLISVTVQWEDGKIGTHCTSLDTKRDYELIPNTLDAHAPLNPKRPYTGAEIKYWCFKNESSYIAKQIYINYFLYSKLNDWRKYYIKMIINGRIFLVGEDKMKKCNV